MTQVAIQEQINAIKKAIQKADSNKANFIAHNKVVDWVESWDTQNERKIPNVKTRNALEETDNGIGLVKCNNIDDLFDKLGM